MEQSIISKAPWQWLLQGKLAAHALGGFFCNFSMVQRFCCFCNIRRDQLNQRNLISKFTLRTENAYINNIAATEEDPDSSALYGLKERSVLNMNYIIIM